MFFLTTYNTWNVILPNLHKRKTLQSTKLQRFSIRILFCAGQGYLSSLSISCTSFAVAVTIRKPLGFYPEAFLAALSAWP